MTSDGKEKVRVLAIDVGTSRCGLAVSDPLGIMAIPLEPMLVLDGASLPQRLAEKAREVGARLILVGLPLEMDGKEGPRARAVKRLAERLRNLIPVPIEFVDERLSTRLASRLLEEAKRPKDKDLLDSASAAVLLQTWLDSSKE